MREANVIMQPQRGATGFVQGISRTPFRAFANGMLYKVYDFQESWMRSN